MGHVEIRDRADVTDEQTKSTREAIEGAAPKTARKSSSLKRLGTIVSQTDVSLTYFIIIDYRNFFRRKFWKDIWSKRNLMSYLIVIHITTIALTWDQTQLLIR